MLAVAMDVQETKRLILRRLDELRVAQGATDSSVRSAAREWQRRRGQPPMSRWFKSRPALRQQDTYQRLQSVEERLEVLEQLFLHSERGDPTRRPGAPPAAGRNPAAVSEPVPGPTQSAAAQAQVGSTWPFDESGNAYRLTGDVSDGLMTDILQMLTSNQKTGRFSLEVDDEGGRFDLYFVDGELTHAEADGLTGEEAFFAVMTKGHESGRYGFAEGGASPSPEKTIEAKTQFLILEALRRIDEERNGGE